MTFKDHLEVALKAVDEKIRKEEVLLDRLDEKIAELEDEQEPINLRIRDLIVERKNILEEMKNY